MSVFRRQSATRRWRSPTSSALVGSVLGLTALGGSLGLVSTSASAAVRSAPAATVGVRPAIPAGAKTIGALPAATRLQATVTLEPASAAALAAYATGVATAGNADYHRYLTTAQFAARFGPSAATIATVRGVLGRDGLEPSAVTADHLSIKVQGTAAQFSKALHTGFAQYHLADGRTAYANTAAPLLPGTIASSVQGVIGLDNLALAHPEGLQPSPHSTGSASPRVVTGGPQPCAAAVTDGQNNSSYTADQLASAYSFSSLYHAGDFGAGQTIALYELEPNLTSDVSAYQSCYGTSATVSYTEVDGGSGTGAGEGEAILDIEVALTGAPKANLKVYQGPNGGSGGYDTYSSIITQNIAKVISTSWGTCEAESNSSTVTSENTLFQEAAIHGQSILDAAGDAGSEDCSQGQAPGVDTELSVDDPGGQPYITAVGGTKLTTVTAPPQETVWNESASGSGAGGGGISKFFDMPSYQTGAASSLHVINANSSGTPCGAATGSYCREVPDVTADADPYTGYVVYYDGQWTGIGGTSAAAPLFASLVALTNASAACNGTNIGFANPGLYAAAGTAYSSDFYDITTGNNDYMDVHGGLYPAAVGYDMASGLGAPDGATLPETLCGGTPTGQAPTVTGISPTSGSTGGGTKVTVTGTGFTGATAVDFGTVAGTDVTVISDTELTVVSPALGAGTTDVRVTTPNGTSAVVSADQFTSVAPSGGAPTVTGISPTSGSTAGGTKVTVTGTGFTGATAVDFGSVAGTDVTVISDTELTVVSPALGAGTTDVRVTTPNGTSAVVTADQFTSVAPSGGAPKVTGISPSSGPAAGGTTVTLTGSGFTGATKVMFATLAGTHLSVVSDTKLTVVSPAATPGQRNIRVTTPNGTSKIVTADMFTSVGPYVTKISPKSGPTGTRVTVTGTGFTGTTKVLFGTVAGTSVTVVNSTTLTVKAPALSKGMRNIRVVTSEGTSAEVSADEFTTT